MTATRRQPPRFAIWLLRQCSPSETGDALLGDVLEKFHGGKSAGWVWREATSLLLWYAASLFRTHTRAIVFALAGTALAELWWGSRWAALLWQSSPIQNLFGWGVGRGLPISAMYDFAFVSAWRFLPLLPPLMIFWYLTGPYRWARISWLMLVGFAVSIAEQLAIFSFPHSRGWFLDQTSIFLVLLVCAVISHKPVDSSRPVAL